MDKLLKGYLNHKVKKKDDFPDSTTMKSIFGGDLSHWSEKMTRLRNDGELVSFCEASSPFKNTICDASDVAPCIAILFVIVDHFPFESIWRLWLKGVNNIQLYFHAKYPDRVSSWVKEHLVTSFQFRPTWGSLELSQVMVYMLNEALQNDKPIERFCFASESCIPIVPVNDFIQRMVQCKVAAVDSRSKPMTSSITESWIHYSTKPLTGYASQAQFEPLKSCLPIECVYKADQWVALSRTHACSVVSLLLYSEFGERHLTLPIAPGADCVMVRKPKNSTMWTVFNKCHPSDEMVIPCCLALLGHLSGKQSHASSGSSSDSLSQRTVEKVANRRLTWCEWETPEGRGKHPTTFHALPLDLLQKAKTEGCVFFRKLKPQLDSDIGVFANAWLQAVYSQEQGANGASVTHDNMKIALNTIEQDIIREEEELEMLRSRGTGSRGVVGVNDAQYRQQGGDNGSYHRRKFDHEFSEDRDDRHYKHHRSRRG